MKLRDQLCIQLLEALALEGMTQADLAREMGITTKHINHLVNGKSGSFGMFDYAAHVLGRSWTVTMEE